MLKERALLENAIQKALKKSATNKLEISDRINYLINKFGIDEKTSGDLVLLRKPLSSISDRMLFMLATLVAKSSVNHYFTSKEIREYSAKIGTGKEKVNIFPIKWNMIKVSDDQFIGSISVQELMQLRDSQLINYNENAQRVMTQKVHGNDIIYQITVNKNAVAGIRKSFKDNTFIPNTITLNIPLEVDFRYEDGELIIDKIDHFDILDGYHRYLAISEEYNINHEFDYQMELRVFSVSDSKARQFIWQEDQKTKMKKMDSEMFNQNSFANQLVQILNETPLLKGIFSQGGYIDPALAGRMLSITLFGDKNKKYTRKDLIDEKKYLYNCFNELSAENEDVLTNKWDNNYTVAFFFAVWKAKNNKEREVDIVKTTEKIYEMSKTQEFKYLFSNISFQKRDLSRLNKVMEEKGYVQYIL